MCFVWPFFAFCSFNHAPVAPIELFLPFHVRTMCRRSPTIRCQYFLHLTQYTIAPCFCSVRTLLCACSAIVLACLQGASCNVSKSARTTAVVWLSVVTASGFRRQSAVLTQYHVLLLHGCTPTSVQRFARFARCGRAHVSTRTA